MSYGYMGKILRVNLSKEKISFEEPEITYLTMPFVNIFQ